jgi:hypothetical protein
VGDPLVASFAIFESVDGQLKEAGLADGLYFLGLGEAAEEVGSMVAAPTLDETYHTI